MNNKTAANTGLGSTKRIHGWVPKLLLWLIVGVIILLITAWTAYELTPQQRAVRDDRRAFSQLKIPDKWIPSLHSEDDNNFFQSMFSANGAGYTYNYIVPNTSEATIIQKARDILKNAEYQTVYIMDGGKKESSYTTNDDVRGYNVTKDVTITVSAVDNSVTFDVTKGKF